MPPSFLSLLVAAVLAADSSGTAPADSAGARRIVRRFEPLEVRAPAIDLRASDVRHAIPAWKVRSPLVSGVKDVLALQPGVVAQAGELHVRGGRAGETRVSLDGLPLNEPIRGRAPELPLLAIAEAELLSGAPDARFGSALAGQLDLRTVDPAPSPELEWRWTSDARLDTHYDRVATRYSAPLPLAGLGLVVAGDVTLDDTSYPALRTQGRTEVLGMRFGWRAENRVLGLVKLAPVRSPDRFSVEVFADRGVHAPYDPAWSLDGWTWLPLNPKDAPRYFDSADTNTHRYKAADHNALTDDRRIGARVSFATAPAPVRGRLSLGWVRDRTVTSTSGLREPHGRVHRVFYRWHTLADRFHVIWGDYPTYHESGSDVLSLAADAEATRGNAWFAGGAGASVEETRLYELDWLPLGRPVGDNTNVVPLDSLRSFHAWAPGGWAYGHARWQQGGMVLNAGLRAEYWTPGPQGRGQTLPWDGRGTVTWSPRFGVSFPVSVREALSFAYVRLHQAPDRDLLYDTRTLVNNRRPLGNPGLQPATVISYEAALKHLFDAEWSTQLSVFTRDVYGQPGARDYTLPLGPTDLRYAAEDEGHVQGVEWTLARTAGRVTFSASYTWMQAWGNESRSSGDPYGAIRDARMAPIADRPLHWDREHTLTLGGEWRGWRAWQLAWTTSVASPLPWTPKPRREPFNDLSKVNSRRLDWTGTTDLGARWTPARARGLSFGVEALNVFDQRGALLATLDGYPNPAINTVYDDYGAYRTETGRGGGAYWSSGGVGGTPYWQPVGDPRLLQAPRTVRASVGARW